MNFFLIHFSFKERNLLLNLNTDTHRRIKKIYLKEISQESN